MKQISVPLYNFSKKGEKKKSGIKTRSNIKYKQSPAKKKRERNPRHNGNSTSICHLPYFCAAKHFPWPCCFVNICCLKQEHVSGATVHVTESLGSDYFKCCHWHFVNTPNMIEPMQYLVPIPGFNGLCHPDRWNFSSIILFSRNTRKKYIEIHRK